MSENNNDLFNRILSSSHTGESMVSEKQISEFSEKQTETVAAPEADAKNSAPNDTVFEKRTDESVASKTDMSTENNGSKDTASGKQASSFSFRGDEQNKQTSTSAHKKINIKKYGVLGVVIIVMLLLAYLAFFIVLPAKTNAAKIQSDLLSSEIESIFNEKISGNALKEKIFFSALSDYPSILISAVNGNEISSEKAEIALEFLGDFSVVSNTALTDVLNEIEELSNSKKSYDVGSSAYQDKNYKIAIEEYEKVVESDLNYPSAQEKLSDSKEKFKTNIINEVNIATGSNEYTEALYLLKEALDVIPEDSDISSKYNEISREYFEYLKSDAMNSYKELISDEKYAEAIEKVRSAIDANVSDSELNAVLKICIDSYYDSISKSVSELVKKRNYDEAIGLIEEALKLLPEEIRLLDLLENTKNSKPVALNQLVLIDSGAFEYKKGLFVDTFGDEYKEQYRFDGHGSYAVYNLKQQYTKFYAAIVCPEDARSDTHSTVSIYVDDEHVLTIDNITKTTGKKNFEIDTKNANTIKIVMDDDKTDNAYFWEGRNALCIVEATLDK